jgi:membrane carboxypeptidase/penicillin-binding protein PbpC
MNLGKIQIEAAVLELRCAKKDGQRQTIIIPLSDINARKLNHMIEDEDGYMWDAVAVDFTALFSATSEFVEQMEIEESELWK